MLEVWQPSHNSNSGTPTKTKGNLIIIVVMTVAGQKNHYNVKLLKASGLFIKLKGNRIYLQNGIYRVNGKWKERGIGGKTMENVEAVEKDGRLFLNLCHEK